MLMARVSLVAPSSLWAVPRACPRLSPWARDSLRTPVLLTRVCFITSFSLRASIRSRSSWLFSHPSPINSRCRAPSNSSRCQPVSQR
ncbi:uncharacterized protein LY79DRAFT_541049 [Colletotrichum navitas]|uniref:Uncharacterized protein n=1 Tax=Colletotrichum navitas TaxID=681940 RepID=A0AAD8VAV0_9PEZI|nr:uncharacterized protein LY79DRAFT_541049 [Colletotrichum navitas]KAK1597770.1 hypothetical protein LY79DRAFT_541049 [Colletotrichum navitas]